jgi:HEAT repeat protein
MPVSRIDALRKSAVPMLTEAANSPQAQIRESAVVALGRIGGHDSVMVLGQRLADSNPAVRNQAILALGATGASEAVSLLLPIARLGGLSDADGARITPLARPIAIVALALGRRAGFDARVDAEVAKLVDASANDSEHARIALAAMMYQKISPCAVLEGLALAIAEDKSEQPAVRSAAIESLRSGRESATLSKLQSFLSGPRMDLRRSAALAMGDVQNPLALAPLLTAFEMEAEPMTRAFTLISIGRQGGPEARAFLLEVLENGEHTMRPWCALALGILARGTEDAGVRSALRAKTADVNTHDDLAAFWIASGLLQDHEATPALVKGLTAAADPRHRMYAATALGLIGDEAALAALRSRLLTEDSDMVQVAIAQSLGFVGAAADAPALLETLNALRNPDLQAQVASAMGFHGTEAALRGLQQLAAAKDVPALTTSSAIDGLGMILSRSMPLTLAEASRQSNYTLFSDWVEDLFQNTL